MPFKNEATMKEALNGLEQAVGEDKWTQKHFAKLLRWTKPVIEPPDASIDKYIARPIDHKVSVHAEGVAFCALGTIDNDGAVGLETGRMRRTEFESRIASKTGMNLDEMRRTMELNDTLGYEAVLDYWRSIGFKSED